MKGLDGREAASYPSLCRFALEERGNIYRNHFQGLRETLGLYRELLHNAHPELRALTEYFRDRYESTKVGKRRPLFSCCVAINSGGALNTPPNPDWVEKDKSLRAHRQ